MERDHVAYLVSETHTPDSLAQMVPTEQRREIFCTIGSVQQSEWFSAGRNGLKAQLRLKVFADDYAGETLVEVDGVRYEIYRTYLGENCKMELYLKRAGGT